VEDQVKVFKEHLKSDNQVVKPIGEFKKEYNEFVELEYGLTADGDYVWHFASHRRERPFPSDPTKFCQYIKTYLDVKIPSDVRVDVLFSPPNWDKKVISVIARGLGKKWNFDEDIYIKQLPKICDLMNEEIKRITPRRRFL